MKVRRLSAGIVAVVAVALVVPVVAMALVAPSLTVRKPTITAGTATQLVATGTPDATSTVVFERFDGAAWVPVRSKVASGGVATLAVKPLVTTVYRATVTSGTEAASSQVATVSVKAKLGPVKVSRRLVREKAEFSVTGTIYPKHAIGSDVVTLSWYRLDGVKKRDLGTPAFTTTAKVVSNEESKSTWASKSTFTPALAKGWWVVRASHVDTDHVASYSPNYAVLKIR